MPTLTISDDVAVRLRFLAEYDGRHIDNLLNMLLGRYQDEILLEDKEAALRLAARRRYAMARAFWHSVGDEARAALTDAELDAQFAYFDDNGVPRLKSESSGVERPLNALTRMAQDAALKSAEKRETETQVDEGSLPRKLADRRYHRARGKRSRRRAYDAG